MDLYQIIHSWGRICLQCGCCRVRPSLFCHHCEVSLWRARQSQNLWWQHHGDLLRGYAHFTWIPNQSRALSLLIEDLKGQHMSKAWDFWAQQVLQGLIEDNIFTEQFIRNQCFPPILVPAPSSTRQIDHAFLFAQKLHRHTGWPLKNCLQKTSRVAQKHLDKWQRQALEMTSDEKISDRQAVIFVDDVVTTGATAKAAYLALGRPPNFFVIALASRHS